MSFPYINAYQQFFDSSGAPLASGTIEFRNPTTNALINSYPTADDADAQTNANDNPLTLNASGAAASGLFLEDGVAYKVTLKDADGNTVVTHDDIRCPTPREPSNVKEYGAKGDGTTDDTTAIQNAINAGPAFMPDGTYKVTSTITLPTGAYLVGESEKDTIINSTVVNAPLFSTDPSGCSFIYVAHLSLYGNNLTGASGSGHCFDFMDPAVDSGSNTPQNSRLEYLNIRDFKGTDDAINSGADEIESAAIMMYDNLAVTLQHIYILDCGHGIYARQTQNCRILDCVIATIGKAGIFSYDNQNLVIENCDIIECGDGSTDGGYPVADAGTGNIISYGDEGWSLTGTKVKTFNGADGDAAIMVKGDGQNITIDRNWLRGNSDNAIQHKAIYAERIAGLTITNNIFYPSNSGKGTAYETIELYTPSVAPAFHSVIENNVFLDVSGYNIDYNIKIHGDAVTRSHRTTIRNNRFGSNSSRSSATTVAADIILSTCLIEDSFIGNNSHYAPTNVTRTAGVNAAGSVVIEGSTIGPSLFQTGGGTITANYSGTYRSGTLKESVLWGGKTYNMPNINDAARDTTTVTVTGAILANGDIATVSYTKDLQGLNQWAYVSADDTVTVVTENRTGGAINADDGALYVKVEALGGSHL